MTKPPASWPSLPQETKAGVWGQVGNRVFAGLGSAGAALFALDIVDRAKGWLPCAPFPGAPREGAASAMAGGRLYVVSGAGKARGDDPTPTVLTDVHAYDPAADRWTRLDTETPAGLLGASAHALDDDRIAFFGGYNKGLFDAYLRGLHAIDTEAEPLRHQALVDRYMGMQPADYRWNDRVLGYTISANRWSDLGHNPWATTGSARVAGAGGITLIHGEIKPGLRTPDARHVTLAGGTPEWSALAPLPAPEGEVRQEGLAGAFAGHSNGVLLVAGGVNFPGAGANADAGRWFAHKGLVKTWRRDIYALAGGKWRLAGQLPHGLAHGASFTTGEGLVIAGGEDGTMAARAEVHLIRWDGTQAVVT